MRCGHDIFNEKPRCSEQQGFNKLKLTSVDQQEFCSKNSDIIQAVPPIIAEHFDLWGVFNASNQLKVLTIEEGLKAASMIAGPYFSRGRAIVQMQRLIAAETAVA